MRPAAPATWQATPVPEPALPGAPRRVAVASAAPPVRTSATCAAHAPSPAAESMTISGTAVGPPSSLAPPPEASWRSISVRCFTSFAASSACFAAASACTPRAAASSSALSCFVAAVESAVPIDTACAARACSSSAIACWRPDEASASVAAFSSASDSLSVSAASCSFTWLPPAPADSNTSILCRFLYTSSAADAPLTTVTSRPPQSMPLPAFAAAVTCSSFDCTSSASPTSHSTVTLFVLSRPRAAPTLVTETSPSSAHSSPSVSPEQVESV
jgi:hypothetical protein